MNIQSISILPPVAIGGIGGSGTRLIAELLHRLGYYIGGDLNEANDNLWFTLLFKRVELWDPTPNQDDFKRAVSLFQSVMTNRAPIPDSYIEWLHNLAAEERLQHSTEWLRQRVTSLIKTLQQPHDPAKRWGWKEPNTYLFLTRLVNFFPQMKYIHVMRNGLDMAYSANQNQLQFWGAQVLDGKDVDITPRNSLRYWCLAHRKVMTALDAMPGQCLLFNYDNFCAAPRKGLNLLLDFLGLEIDVFTKNCLASLVRSPATIGRFKQYGLLQFDPEDIAYSRNLTLSTLNAWMR